MFLFFFKSQRSKKYIKLLTSRIIVVVNRTPPLWTRLWRSTTVEKKEQTRRQGRSTDFKIVSLSSLRHAQHLFIFILFDFSPPQNFHSFGRGDFVNVFFQRKGKKKKIKKRTQSKSLLSFSMRHTQVKMMTKGWCDGTLLLHSTENLPLLLLLLRRRRRST